MQWLDSLQDIHWRTFLLEWGLKCVAGLLILVIGLRLARALAGLVDRALVRANVEATATAFLRKVVYVVLLVLLALTVLSVFDVPMTSAFAVLGAAGLAIGLALKDSLSNIASGVMLVTLKPFRAGDVVNINGESGRVEEISIFQTRLRGADNQTIVLPNSLVTTHSIINMTPDTMRRVELVVGIAYDADIDAARAAALAVMRADPRVLAEPAPDVRVYALADNSVDLGIRCHTANGDWFDVKCDMLERIKKAFDAAGIAIPFPQRDVHVYRYER
ncbi:mechanosensitive ion channel family protein [Cognatilysobacter segetis]|uniref:mechanosensitive ion channel family protein n=1 Tax=Cognatilysobacter segetis TaxID=2492394 RepID=UPI00138F9EA4|nr:mechanosensitive ion channel domain-containing protein [Lysobacter segetis]